MIRMNEIRMKKNNKEIIKNKSEKNVSIFFNSNSMYRAMFNLN